MKFSYPFKFYFLLYFLFSLSFINLAPASSKIVDLEKNWGVLNLKNPKGKIHSLSFSSQILKNKREVWVYTPPSYQWLDGPYPLLVVFDGQAYTSELIPTAIILDNLLAEKKIPPLVALFFNSIDQETRSRELSCNSRLVKCLMQELLPWLSRRFFVTKSPSQTIIAGSSLGGLAAAYVAYCHPERFGNVLSQSGAFWWNPIEESHEPWLIQQFETASSPLPIHFYLDVGNQETEKNHDQMSMIELNQHLHKILENKGCSVIYYEFEGDHDYESWRKTFAYGLISLSTYLKLE